MLSAAARQVEAVRAEHLHVERTRTVRIARLVGLDRDLIRHHLGHGFGPRIKELQVALLAFGDEIAADHPVRAGYRREVLDIDGVADELCMAGRRAVARGGSQCGSGRHCPDRQADQQGQQDIDRASAVTQGLRSWHYSLPLFFGQHNRASRTARTTPRQTHTESCRAPMVGRGAGPVPRPWTLDDRSINGNAPTHGRFFVSRDARGRPVMRRPVCARAPPPPAWTSRRNPPAAPRSLPSLSMMKLVGMPAHAEARVRVAVRIEQHRQAGDVVLAEERGHRRRAAAIRRQRQHGDVGGRQRPSTAPPATASPRRRARTRWPRG